ncbi:MAG: phospholipase D-like domain-containing protein [Gemmatimonadota bacterium]
MRAFLASLPTWWPYAAGALAFAMSLVASLHAVLRKRDVRAAIGWVGLIWLAPWIGAIVYAAFGLNRIKRRASQLHRQRRRLPLSTTAAMRIARAKREILADPQLRALAHLGDRLTERSVVGGNAVRMLRDGDESYPVMLEAIQGAQRSIALSTYIFASDESGRPFIDALIAAHRRGVEVRVLVDGFGSLYTWPRAHTALQQAGVRAELFAPQLRHAGLAFFNLRNHRKILTIDGAIAFTGGTNIRRDNLHAVRPKHPVRDLHFRITGPVVAQIQDAFAEDWVFSTGEILDGPAWYPELTDAGGTIARVITDGPDGDLEVLSRVLHGAIDMARESITILTPYFLPDPGLITALSVAALRGVEVRIVLPAHVNIVPVQWAAAAQLWQVLRPGCRVFLSPKPFDHSKLMVVDRHWALVGSTNWDPRSLRLNFELDVELYCATCASALDDHAQARIAESREVSLAELDGRPLGMKVRDGLARLLSPYL